MAECIPVRRLLKPPCFVALGFGTGRVPVAPITPDPGPPGLHPGYVYVV